VLLINIHKLDIILGDAVVRWAHEDEVDDVWGVFSLECEDVRGLCCTEDFGERVEVDAESDVTVAAIGLELLGAQHHGDEGDVRVVHCLEGDAGVIAVEIAVLD